MTVDEHRLTKVVEPTALVMYCEGRFIVADAKNQKTFDPANLYIFDPNAIDPNKVEVPILGVEK